MNPLKRFTTLLDKNSLIDASLIVVIAILVVIYKMNKM